jgi:hypothetical protein
MLGGIAAAAQRGQQELTRLRDVVHDEDVEGVA